MPRTFESTFLGRRAVRYKRSSARVFVSYHRSQNVDHEDGDLTRLKFLDLLNQTGTNVMGRSIDSLELNWNVRAREVKEYILENYIFDTNVTAVLIGARTWQRMFVDWEIRSSIHKQHSGLLGIFLPSNPNFHRSKTDWDYGLVPSLLADNCAEGCNFASLHKWTSDAKQLQSWVLDALARRGSARAEHGRPPLHRNLQGSRWNLPPHK